MAADSLASARLAMDVRGLNGLKRAAMRDPQAQLKNAARQFEALFLGRMLKTMRSAGFQSDLTSNRQVKLYQSLFDQQLAQSLAGRGVGIAQMLVNQLSHTAAPATRPQSLAGVGPVVDAAVPSAPAPTDLSARATGMASAAPAMATAAARRPDSVQGAFANTPAGRFVHRFAGVAQTAAQASGVSPLLILAQAALETGWGRHTAATATGADSHNLFGIKAGSGWRGATADNATREYVDGRMQQVQQRFRAYGSEAESFRDHARLLGDSPRYAAVRNASSPQQAARALQASGYATDPHYADKLITIMRQIGDVLGL